MTSNTDLTNLIKIFREYQKVPNVPFLPKFTSKFVKYFLDENNVSYIDDPYSIIVTSPSIREGIKNKRKIIFMAHVDHPGVILRDKENGIMMGLNEPKVLAQLIKKQSIPIVIYDQQGKFLGKAQIIKFNNDAKQRVKIRANFNIPKNSFGHFDVARFSEDENKFYVYNADDGIMVSIMLDLIIKKIESDYDIYFVFNKHEEVFQISSWNLAKFNFLDLEEEDIIINLECLKTESVNPEKYPTVSYENGPVLQLSNKGCLFGYKNQGKNLAEIIVRKIAEENSLILQVGLISDSCDSRPFTQFGITSNICTITIPNKYKHDGADDGNIRPEEIYKKDVECVEILLEKITLSNPNIFEGINTESLSEKVKMSDDVTNKNLMSFKKRLNNRLDISYRHIVKRGYFYPYKPFDYIADFILKVISYISYTISKIR